MCIGTFTRPVNPKDKCNVQWTNGMPNGHFDWVFMVGNITPYDVLISSTACCSEARMFAIEIYAFDRMDPMDTECPRTFRLGLLAKKVTLLRLSLPAHC